MRDCPLPASKPVTPRKSKRTLKQPYRFTFTPAIGYHAIRSYGRCLIKTTLMLATATMGGVHSQQYNACYAAALALDPEFGVLDKMHGYAPDFLNCHPFLFKAKATPDHDTPGVHEALSGPYHDHFIEAMNTKIDELEAHGTWTVINHADLPKVSGPCRTIVPAPVIPSTWTFRIK